ncbi:MAG: hypothetical protein E6Q99_09685 [Elusimicrobia bacterium]|nr:MAG: hypothetical protein E6Q99_09685 [Elusimicrobiota bacterium]
MINGDASTSETIIDDQAITTSYAPPSGGECDTPPLACPSGSNLYGTSVGGFCCSGATDGNTCSTLNMCALDPTRAQNQPLCCPTGMNLYGMWAGGFCCAGAIGSGGNTCTTNEVCALDPSRTQGYNLCTSLRCPPGMNFYGASKGGFCCNGTVSASGDTCSTADVCALDASRPQGNRVCGSRCLSRGPVCNTSVAAGQCAFAASNAVEQCRKHPQCSAVTCNKSTGWCFARDTTQLGPWTGFASIFVQKDIPAGPFQDQAAGCGPGGCIASGPGCDTSAVPGQCSFPRAQAVDLCSKHPQCIAVVCNQSRADCQARDTLERAPWRGMNSTLLTRLDGQAILCGPGGCIASGPGCDTSAVPGQCSFPTGSALESCRKHPQCKAVVCNALRTDCQARDTTEHVPGSGFTSYIVDKR